MSFNINLQHNEENEKIDNIINGVTTHYNWFYNFQGLDDKNKYLFNVPNFFIIKYKEIKKGKITFHQFEDDEKLYNIHNLSYMLLKKKLLLPFQILLKMMGHLIGQDLLTYLNDKFFNNLNKAEYYNMCSWFVFLFYYYFQSLIHSEENTIINYKPFRRWCLQNKIIISVHTSEHNSAENEAIRKILLLYKNELPTILKNNYIFKGLFNHFLIYVQNGSGYRLH